MLTRPPASDSEGPKPNSRLGCLLTLLGLGVVGVFGCCVLSSLAFRPAVDVNTFYPKTRMTVDEMRAKYGPPTETYSHPDGTATWFYSTGMFGFTAVGVNFSASGHVVSSFNH